MKARLARFGNGFGVTVFAAVVIGISGLVVLLVAGWLWQAVKFVWGW